MEFKKGDKVVCIDADVDQEIIIGELYTIVEDMGTYVNVRDKSGNFYSGYFRHRFKLHKSINRNLPNWF